MTQEIQKLKKRTMQKLSTFCDLFLGFVFKIQSIVYQDICLKFGWNP